MGITVYVGRHEDELMRYKGDKELMLSDNMQNSIERRDRYMVKHAGERIRNDIERQRTRDRKCICGPYI